MHAFLMAISSGHATCNTKRCGFRRFLTAATRSAAQAPPTHLLHLALGDAAAVIDDPRGLEAGGLVELDEQLPHHVGQVLDHFLAEELLLRRKRS